MIKLLIFSSLLLYAILVQHNKSIILKILQNFNQLQLTTWIKNILNFHLHNHIHHPHFKISIIHKLINRLHMNKQI